MGTRCGAGGFAWDVGGLTCEMGVSVGEMEARKELTTKSLLAKSLSGVFRFWEGEAGRAVREKSTSHPTPSQQKWGRTRCIRNRTRVGDVL